MEKIRENNRIQGSLSPRHLIWLGFNGGDFSGTCGSMRKEEIINVCNILVVNPQGKRQFRRPNLDTYIEG